MITPVFASGDGAFLGIERPTVPVGDGSFPVLSTLPSVKGPFTDSTEAGQTDATFVANSLAPERLQASFQLHPHRRGQIFGSRFFAAAGIKRRIAGASWTSRRSRVRIRPC